MEKNTRKNMYEHINKCISLITKCYEIHALTKKKSSDIKDVQKQWSDNLLKIDAEIGVMFSIFQKERKKIVHESVKEFWLRIIQDISTFIKANRIIRMGNAKQLTEIEDILRKLVLFEKKMEQHIHVLSVYN